MNQRRKGQLANSGERSRNSHYSKDVWLKFRHRGNARQDDLKRSLDTRIK